MFSLLFFIQWLVNYKKQKKYLRRERIKLNQWLRLPHDQNMRGIIGELKLILHL
jgi:hypothetical protein